MSTILTAISEACSLVGGQANLARQLAITPAAVSQWVMGKRPIPPQHCLAIERATGGKVTRANLRPDDFWLIWPDLAAPEETTSKAA